MGKPKEKKPVKLPAASDVPAAKRLVENVARAKARHAKIGAADVSAARKRAAKKRLKRAQRRLRSTLAYAASRKKAEPAGGEAAPAS